MANTKGQNENMKNQLQNQAANGNGGNGKPQKGQQGQSPAQTIYNYLKQMGPEIQRALPKHMDVDRLTRIALTTIRQNPKLLQCNIQSLLGSVMQCAQLGLEPNIMGHAYLVPFYNSKQKTYDVQFIMGYRGMIDLARRSGNIQSIFAHEVCEKDEFDYEYGLEPTLKHKPALTDRGKVIGFYAVAKFKDGGYQFEFMPVEEIEKRRQRSKAANSGPWQTDYEEMGKKTVIRHMFKYLPVSIEVMQQVSQDETVKEDIKAEDDLSDTIDITGTWIDEEGQNGQHAENGNSNSAQNGLFGEEDPWDKEENKQPQGAGNDD